MKYPIRSPWRPPRGVSLMSLLAVTALLAACGSAPRKAPPAGSTPSAPRTAPGPERDGPEANPPPNLDKVPDAQPKVEPLRVGGPNKPYEVLGRSYTPMTRDEPAVERGPASWYGRKFHGRRTASGELYNMYAMTAAHPTFPIPSYARVRNPANGREVIVRINDRGPFKGGRVIDLSYTAALKLGILHGVTTVEVERITHEAIRTGSWRNDVLRGEPPRAGPDDASRLAVLPAAEAQQAAEPPQRTVEWGDPLPGTAEAIRPAPTDTDTTAVAGTTIVTLEGTTFVPAPAAPPAPSATAPSSTAPSVTPAAPAAATTADARTETLPSERAGTVAARGWWLQLGAFKAVEGAAQFERQVAGEAQWLAPLLAMFRESALYKLQAGPFPSRAEALAANQRLRSQLQLVPMLVERR